jgi:hypothetical protein
MTSPVDYALLAGASYVDTRDPINQFPLPPNWTLLLRNPLDAATGFEASVLENGTEIVIWVTATTRQSNLMRTT